MNTISPNAVNLIEEIIQFLFIFVLGVLSVYVTTSVGSPAQKGRNNNSNGSSGLADEKPQLAESGDNELDRIKPSSQKPEYLTDTRGDSDLLESHPAVEQILNAEFNKLKINTTEYSTVSENEMDTDMLYEDEDDDEEEWDYNLEDNMDDGDYDEDVENLSRTKRRKTKFAKKTFGYGKGSKTGAGHGVSHGGTGGFEGAMGRRRKKGKFSNEYYIKRAVLKNYDSTTRPVKNDTTTVTVYIGMSLYHILDTVSYIIIILNFCIQL